MTKTVGRTAGKRSIGKISLSELEEEWTNYINAVVDRWAEDSGDRKQERSKRREQEILRAALHVFARDGISRARIGDIAAEAGMPVSSLYDYYPSKEDLAYAVPHEHLARFYEEYRESVAKVGTFRERLRLYLWTAADFARRNPEWARTLYLEIWPSVLVSETSVRHSIDDYARVIVHLIRSGETAGEWPAPENVYEMASILIGSVNQVITVWLLYRKPRDLMRAISSVVARIMTLLGDPPPAMGGKANGSKPTKGRRQATEA